MSLSQDIKQKEFRNEYHKAILNILYTHNYLVTRMNEVFKKFDLTRQQFNVLRILRGQYPSYASINLIKERMLDRMSDTSRMVERLRLKGLISRTACKSDKRSVEIRITSRGLALLGTMEDSVNSCERFLHNLDIRETMLLNELLDKMRDSETEQTLEATGAFDLAHEAEKF